MEGITDTSERVDWLTENYDLSKRNALALILSEMGYSHSGIASKLDVTAGTARKYLKNLEKEIGDGVTEVLPKSRRYPTFPGDTPKSEVKYSGDNVDLSEEFQDRDTSLNRGVHISQIPKDCITIGVEK